MCLVGFMAVAVAVLEEGGIGGRCTKARIGGGGWGKERKKERGDGERSVREKGGTGNGQFYPRAFPNLLL